MSHFIIFNNLYLSLVTAKHQSREMLKISETLGLWEGTQKLSSRLMEVQSRMNCDSWDLEGLFRMPELGWTEATVFTSSVSSATQTVVMHSGPTWKPRQESYSFFYCSNYGLNPDP